MPRIALALAVVAAAALLSPTAETKPKAPDTPASVADEEGLEYCKVFLTEYQVMEWSDGRRNSNRKARAAGRTVREAEDVICTLTVLVWAPDDRIADVDAERIMDRVARAWRRIPTAPLTGIQVYLLAPAWRTVNLQTARSTFSRKGLRDSYPWFARKCWASVKGPKLPADLAFTNTRGGRFIAGAKAGHWADGPAQFQDSARKVPDSKKGADGIR